MPWSSFGSPFDFAGAARGQLAEEPLEAGGVDAPHLGLALQDELRELGANLADLLPLEAADDLGQALRRVALDIDAPILEVLQEGLADALLGVHVPGLARVGNSCILQRKRSPWPSFSQSCSQSHRHH